MKFKTVPSHLDLVPKNIRANAKANDVTVHDDWTDLLLLNLWDAMLHDDELIEASLGMDPAEVLTD